MRDATSTLPKSLRLAAIAVAAVWFGSGLPAQAQSGPPDATSLSGLVRMGDVDTGTLLLKTMEEGFFVEAPLVAADVQIDVTGLIVRARVTQRFENPSDQWVEGVYVFPLPEDSGVDRLRMIIGDRFIEGQINERQEARRIYEEARAQGRRASLVEQERPNMFTNSVANIGPGETVVVQIEYQDTARLRDGSFAVRFPMVVGPRYNPEPDYIQSVDFDGGGFAVGDPVPDRARIEPPVAHPNDEPNALRLPVVIHADIRAGFDLGEVTSPYHGVDVERIGEARALVSLADGAVPANRDFVVEWTAADGAAPHAALFQEEHDGETYILAMVTPPAGLGADVERLPRETIFVIDNSGSMAGPSMVQAKAALLLALERLQPEDRFNVVRFDDTMNLVFPQPVDATKDNIDRAMRFVSSLNANGGTEMLPALQAALVDATPGDQNRVRQVIFLTDGAIGNEAQLFSAIDAGLGRSRLFTVGIGSAPNSYFMNRAARIGRGTFTHIGDVSEVAEETARLFEALERPVMTDLSAIFPRGAAVEAWPNPLPDLYAGEPIVVTARLERAEGVLRIEGDLAGSRWRADLDLADAAEGDGVAVLWARSKIAAIEEYRFEGVSTEAVDRLVLETALGYSLVSRLTSLVAVDVTPARPTNAPLARADVPLMLPDGWDFEAVFGRDVRPLQRDAMRDDVRFANLRPSTPAGTETADSPDGLALPQGATSAQIRMLIGALLIALGLAGVIGVRRRSPRAAAL